MPIRSAWASVIQQASWNGVPFKITNDAYSTGRRVATHEFPFRDTVIVEDLGLGRRSIMISGFLVGDDVFAQRDRLKRACERAGSGPLVHPTLGNIQCALVGAGFVEDAERGRTVEVQLQFLVTDSKASWPTNSPDSQFVSRSSATELSSAVHSDFFTSIHNGLYQINGAMQTATQFVNTALQPLRDAGRLVNSVIGVSNILPGVSLGRYIDGNISRFSTPLNSVLSPLTRVVGTANRLTSGVTAITNNLTRLDYSTRNAFDMISSTAGLL